MILLKKFVTYQELWWPEEKIWIYLKFGGCILTGI